MRAALLLLIATRLWRAPAIVAVLLIVAAIVDATRPLSALIVTPAAITIWVLHRRRQRRR